MGAIIGESSIGWRYKGGGMQHVTCAFIAWALAVVTSAGISNDVKASMNEIFVDYEYGDLKEAIVGVPFTITATVNRAPQAKEHNGLCHGKTPVTTKSRVT